jgi:hypothetical protein
VADGDELIGEARFPGARGECVEHMDGRQPGPVQSFRNQHGEWHWRHRELVDPQPSAREEGEEATPGVEAEMRASDRGEGRA